MMKIRMQNMTPKTTIKPTRIPNLRQLAQSAAFPSLEAIVEKVASEFTPNERLSITESAQRYTHLGDGSKTWKWSLDKTPYLEEPQDVLLSFDYRGMIFIGPSRTGKSVMFLNWITHTVMNDPQDMLFVHNDATNARKWSKGEFDRYLKASPEIRKRQMTARQYDNTYDKQFKSGMRFNLTYPTGPNLSAITVGKVGIMDYDRNNDQAIESSSVFDIASVRIRTKGRRGMIAAESSPNPDKEMQDPKWRPDNPHQAPPSPGIFELYNRGDCRLFMWQCVHADCNQWFEGTFDLLKGWQDCADPLEAAESVYMECPCCGGKLLPSDKAQMNRSGKWVPEGAQIDANGRVVAIPGRKVRRSKYASFWLKGVAAGYFSWGELVTEYLNALRAYEETGDEGPLRKTVTTDQGTYYISKARMSDRNPDDLRERAENWGSTQENPTVPWGVRFLVATVDVQKDGFVAQVTGFSPNGDATVIDGFKIRSSSRLDADGANIPVDPRAFAEDWDLLVDQVALKTYPLADGSGRRMRIKMSSVDGYGLDGVTINAYRFWQRLLNKGDGLHRKFAIIKGEKKASIPIAQTTFTEVGDNVRKFVKPGAIPRIHFNSTLIKDTTASYMSRRVQTEDTEIVGGKLRYPDWMPAWFYKQMTNEIRKPKGWEKIGSRNNESFDCTAYALGLVFRPVERDAPWDNIQLHRIDWSVEPIWAKDWDENELVFGGAQEQVVKPKASVSFGDLAEKLA